MSGPTTRLLGQVVFWMEWVAYIIDALPCPERYEDYKPVVFYIILQGLMFYCFNLSLIFVKWAARLLIYFFKRGWQNGSEV